MGSPIFPPGFTELLIEIVERDVQRSCPGFKFARVPAKGNDVLAAGDGPIANSGELLQDSSSHLPSGIGVVESNKHSDA